MKYQPHKLKLLTSLATHFVNTTNCLVMDRNNISSRKSGQTQDMHHTPIWSRILRKGQEKLGGQAVTKIEDAMKSVKSQGLPGPNPRRSIKSHAGTGHSSTSTAHDSMNANETVGYLRNRKSKRANIEQQAHEKNESGSIWERKAAEVSAKRCDKIWDRPILPEYLREP